MSGKTKLFEHQKQALLKIWEKASLGELDPTRRTPNTGASLLVMGVGTGKTVVITCLPFVLAPYMQGRQTIIVVDNCTLRGRIIQDFPTDERHCPIYGEWSLYNLGILPPGVPPPQIAELRAESWRSYGFNLDSADLLVVNRQFLLQLVNRGDIDPGNVGLLIIDEAHHSPASTYRTVFEYFSTSMLVFLTGSRFRSDSKPIPYIRYNMVETESESGATLMRYSLVCDFEFTIQQAWKLEPPPIKRLMYKEATSKALLVEESGQEVEYTREAFFAKADSDREWLRQILLADSFCMPVLQQAVSILQVKRATGLPHKMIVRALNIPHAHRLFKLLDSFELLAGKVGLVHSDKDGFDLAGRPTEVYKKFFSGEYICLVHCSMVGEGFSHEWASVCVPLCVMKSLTVAEQEFGRIIRRVKGRPPGKFPDYNHENWGVVVTHEMLGIGELFQKFIEGMPTAPLSGYGETLPIEPVVEKPRLMSEYEAGETTLTLTNTQTLKPGDLIVLSATIEPVVQSAPKFDIVEELRSTNSLSIKQADNAGGSPEENETATQLKTPQQIPLPILEEQQPNPSITDRVVDMIAEHLHKQRETRTVSVQVEAVLDKHTVQIAPIWSDLPIGTDIVKKPIMKQIPETQANFINHVGLDWTILAEGELIKFSDYRKRVVLRRHNLDLNPEGEIVNDEGKLLQSVMPPGIYEIFLTGLKTEIEQTAIEIPHPEVPCRPDEIKKSLQDKYGKRIRASIFELLDEAVCDGRSGRSLIVNPPLLIQPLMSHENNKGVMVSFNYQNNTQLLHKVVFAHIKEITLKKWSMHETESDYAAAFEIAKSFLLVLRQEISQKTPKSSSSSIVDFPTKKGKRNQVNYPENLQHREVESWISFSIIYSVAQKKDELEPLMTIPESIARYILDNCGITDSLTLNLILDGSIIPSLREVYNLIKHNCSSEDLLSYIVALGKQLQTHKVLVHQVQKLPF